VAELRRVRRLVRDDRADLGRASRHDERGALRQPAVLERTLIFLLFVSIIPWPTALAAEHIRQGGEAARAVALLYAATMMLMGLSMAFSWRYLREHEQLIAEPARPAMPAGARRALLGSLAYVPAIAFALLVPVVSLAIDAAIAIYFALSRSEVPGLVYNAALKDGSW
jgi:TMEM175 potassium channel family protein